MSFQDVFEVLLFIRGNEKSENVSTKSFGNEP